MSLDNLGIRLGESGDRAGALAAARRAVEIREALARENPAAYLPDLARSLDNLGIHLSEGGDRAGALAPARRAAEIREALAEDNPAAYRPDLAGSLHNLGIHLSQSGDRAGALAAARRAVEIYEALAREHPAAYLPDLAASLNNLGIRLSEGGDRAGGRPPNVPQRSARRWRGRTRTALCDSSPYGSGSKGSDRAARRLLSARRALPSSNAVSYRVTSSVSAIPSTVWNRPLRSCNGGNRTNSRATCRCDHGRLGFRARAGFVP